MENLFNNVELERELSTFAHEVLNDNGIDFTKEDADEVAQFMIECLYEKAKEKNKSKVFFGLSDKVVGELVLKSVDYLDEWRKEKANAEKEKKAEAKKQEAKQTKAIEKARKTPATKTEKPKADDDLSQIKVSSTARKFVQLEIDFDNY